LSKAAALFLSAVSIPLLFGAPSAPAEVLARVVSVHDGDTLTVLVDTRQVKVRLKDIDAPEMGQPFGRNARQSLSDLCFGKVAAIEIGGRDRYRRAIAQVTCSGTDANAEQVRRGLAWTYSRYAPRDSPLFAVEQEARTARRGLWTDPAPVAPWNWRRTGRQSRVKSDLLQAARAP
jgi:endonuclease YncB( thermonuclease family)